ncbi:PLD nuclease N-terminal domain-containing protein [uncultured Aquimarina sp.]|nr:PLD nuclease N-terminal domain-containing protein [uncultured Aquimarina sp.]
MYCLIHILRSRFGNNDKIIWVLVVLIIPFIGSLLYLFIGKRRNAN